MTMTDEQYQEEMNKHRYKLSEESAIAQADSLLDWYDKQITEQSPIFLEMAYRDLIILIRKGTIEVLVETDTISVIHHLLKKPTNLDIDTITYGEMLGRHKEVVGKCNPNNTWERQVTLLAAMSKEDKKVFNSMRGGDTSVVDTLGTLFLLL